MKKFLKKDGVYLLTWGILFLITFLLVVVNREYRLSQLFSDKYAIITLILLVFIGIFYFFILRNIDRKEIDLSKIFLVIAIPIGILYCLANPLGRTPDEKNHLFRAYEISLGHLFSEPNENGAAAREFNTTLDRIVNPGNTNYDKYFENLSSGDEETKKTYDFSNTALYSPICYLPQALAILITRVLRCNFVIQIYAARIANFAVSIALIYFAIKKIPFKKLIVMLIAFLPISFNEFASLSPDALTNAITLFFLAYVLYLKMDQDKKVTRKDYVILILSTIVLSMCKIVYIPICVLLFLIPYDKFNSKKEKYLKLGLLLGGVILLNLAWLIFASRFLVEFNEGVNSAEQVKFILTHPIQYGIVLIRTLNFNFQTYCLGIVGEGLSCLNVGISGMFEFSLLLLLGILFICNDNKEIKIDRISRILIIAVLLCVILLIFTSLYVQWTPVQKGIVEGVQARYFIPILLLIALSINNTYCVMDKKWGNRYILLFIVFLNLHALTCIMSSYL